MAIDSAIARILLATLFVLGWASGCKQPSGTVPRPPPASADANPGAAPIDAAVASALPAPDLTPVGASSPSAPSTIKAKSGHFPVFTDPGELPELHLKGEPDTLLPLEHTHVSASLSGIVAQVEVTQTYANKFDEPIEAEYVFPLPENAAVYHMKMVIDGRVIEARVEERETARREYEAAKQAGHAAALLEQERPNVFTQSVANIPPGASIEVVVSYVQDLTYDAGTFEFVFPMVVGPRFTPGQPLDGPSVGSGTHPDTDVVLDASRVTPPILGKGTRSGHDISLELVAAAGIAVGDFEVPTHDVEASRRDDGSLHLRLAAHDDLPNRDFVLRYGVAGAQPRATLLSSEGADGFFTLIVHPPELDVEDLVGRREIIFVVDVSGSMNGVPLGLCKEAMREAIGNLRPVDTFNVVSFAGATGKAFERPVVANSANISEALGFVQKMTAGGGTYMLDAIDESLRAEVGAGRHRYVFFLTDGYVSNEHQILSATRSFVQRLEANGQRARVFGFGVGSSVNRHLLDGLSREGQGVTVYATNREDPHRAVNQFYRYIDASVLRDVTVDFGDNEAFEMMPAEIPDLFASRPTVVHGRMHGSFEGPIEVVARSAQGTIRIPVEKVHAPSSARATLGRLWAREKVRWLESALWNNPHDPVAKREITDLGLRFHLVTPFTSLIAVDLRTQQQTDGTPKKIVQPVELAEDVVPHAPGLSAGGVAPSGGYAQEAEARSLDEDAGDADPSDYPVSASAPMEPPSAERGPRGCACRAGPLPDGTSSGWLVLGLIGLWLARRKARVRTVQLRAVSGSRSGSSPGSSASNNNSSMR